MPIIIAGFIRAAISFAVTIGAVSLAEKFILPLINRAIQEVIEAFGVDEERAKDIVANSWLAALEEIGVAAATIRSKTPVKIAKLLGFESKGFTKRLLPKVITDKFPFLAPGASKATSTAAAAVTEKVAAVAKSRGVSLDTASKVATLIVGGLGVPIGAGLLLINTIDFAAWPTSAYQDTFQKFFAIFGIEADKAKVTPKVLSDDQFNKAFEVFRLTGATEINNPYSGLITPFNRANLLQLLDNIAAAILVENGKYTINQVIGTAIGYIIKGKQPPQTTPASTHVPTRPALSASLPSRTTTTFQTSGDDLTNIALSKVSNFLDGLPARLDFELGVRQNPVDETGKFLSGKFYTLQIKLRSGQFGKTKLTEEILRPLAGGEKALSTTQEEPFEEALRQAANNSLKNATLATTDFGESTPAGATSPSGLQFDGSKPYIQFLGSPDVFERATGRYIPQSEASRLLIFANGLVDSINTPRPEVTQASDYAVYAGKDLAMRQSTLEQRAIGLLDINGEWYLGIPRGITGRVSSVNRIEQALALQLLGIGWVKTTVTRKQVGDPNLNEFAWVDTNNNEIAYDKFTTRVAKLDNLADVSRYVGEVYS